METVNLSCLWLTKELLMEGSGDKWRDPAMHRSCICDSYRTAV